MSGVWKDRQAIAEHEQKCYKSLMEVLSSNDFTKKPVVVKDIYGVKLYTILEMDFDGCTISYTKGREAYNYKTGEPYLKVFSVTRFKELEWLRTVEIFKTNSNTEVINEF